MNEPRNYPDFMQADDEAERDARCYPLPEPFGAELARRFSQNPEFRAWAERNVRVMGAAEARAHFLHETNETDSIAAEDLVRREEKIA